MEENSKIKKLLFIGVAIVILTAVFWFGTGLVSSYYYKKGAEAYRQNNFPAAKNNLNTSLIFGPKNPRAHFLLGKIALGVPAPKTGNYYPQANYSEAAGHYEASVSLGLEQKNQNLYRITLDDLGGAYWKLNELDKAREKYVEKLSKFPDSSFWARYFIALDDFNRLNKPEEALEILLPALNLAASDNDKWNLFRIHALLARLYSYFDDAVNAEKYAKLAIEDSSGMKNFDIQVAYAIISAFYGKKKNFELAEAEIEKAVSAGMSLDGRKCALANSYFIGKNYAKAVEIAKSAGREASYERSICLFVLGQSYFVMGKMAEAKKYFQEYLDLTDTFSDKNIFVSRNRQKFEGELLKLK